MLFSTPLPEVGFLAIGSAAGRQPRNKSPPRQGDSRRHRRYGAQLPPRSLRRHRCRSPPGGRGSISCGPLLRGPRGEERGRCQRREAVPHAQASNSALRLSHHHRQTRPRCASTIPASPFVVMRCCVLGPPCIASQEHLPGKSGIRLWLRPRSRCCSSGGTSAHSRCGMRLDHVRRGPTALGRRGLRCPRRSGRPASAGALGGMLALGAAA